jgi:amino acid adenylation domain-containing protein
MLVTDFLDRSALRFPEKTALVCGKRRLTFNILKDRTDRMAAALHEHGFSRQGRGLIWLPPSSDVVISLFGILKANGVFSVINPQVKAGKAAFLLNDSGAEVLITDTRHYREWAAESPDCPSLKHVILTDGLSGNRHGTDGAALHSFQDILESGSMRDLSPQPVPSDLAALIYTSGTTRNPKGVMMTHLNMVTAAESIISYLENTPDDIILNALPLSFDYGLYQVLMAVKFGGTVVLESSFSYPFKVIEKLLSENVTVFPIVPTMAAILLRLKDLGRYRFPSLRTITSTGQVLPPKYVEELKAIFPGARIYSMYGLTECKRVSFLLPEELSRRPASVGKAIPNTETFILDDSGQVVTRPGEIGELVVRGPHVMKGYWNRPEETAEVLSSHRDLGEILRTGDLFKMDEEGFLYFVSRRDDMIKVSGERVSPREVEKVLCEIPDVMEASVIGVEDEILGSAVKAFVVLREGSRLNSADIIRFSARSLEIFMVPKEVKIMASLPQSPHGKTTKRDLK